MIMFGEDETLLLIPAIMLEEEVSSYIPLSVEASFLNVAMLEKEEEANASSLNTMVCKEGASVSIAMLEEEASFSTPLMG